jgi:hypothetical protein
MEQDQKDYIIKLWQEGQSGGHIAESLKITRNSVMGIIHRAKRDGMKLRDGVRTPANKKLRELKMKKTQLKIIPQVQTQPEIKPQAGKTLDDLKHGDCRYIVSMHDTYGAVYCAEPIHKASYCTDHAKICYITPSR